MKRAEFRLKPLALALRNAGILVFAAALAPGMSGSACAQVPTGGVVTQGTASIANVSPTQQRITQGSDKAVINWQTFSIGAPNSVVFAQPGAGSVVLNRVIGGDASSILGKMSANGQVFLVNPNGVYFGPNAMVDVTGIVATTLNIRDSDFMAGRYVFARDLSSPARAAVINDGLIRATPGGYVVLAGDYAANNGIVEARLGTAILAAAGKFTLDIAGDSLINFAINEQTLAQLAGVANSGTVLADGGRVLMTASVARDLSATVVNNTGVVQARGTTERDGAIYLTADGGDVVSSGRLDASGPHGGQITVQAQNGTTLVSGAIDASGSTGAGGTVQLLGNRVGLVDNATVDASGGTAGGTVMIGGDIHGGNPLIQNASQSFVGANTTINADANASGNGGKVVVWGSDTTQFYGNITARGGANSGNGGFVETSGGALDVRGTVNTLAANGSAGTWLLDPHNITVATGGAATLVQVNAFGLTPAADSVIAPTTINAAATNVVLQANTDITFTNAVAITTGGVGLTAQAGRSVLVNANISTNNGAITLGANDAGATPANRDAGLGNITLGAGTTVNSGTAALTLTVGAGANGDAISGSGNLQTTGTLVLKGVTGVGSAVTPIATQGITGLAATSATGGVFISNSGSGAVNITTSGGVTGVSTTTSGDIQVSNSAGGITAGSAVQAAGAGNVTLTTTGTTNNIAVNAGVGSATNNVFLNSGGTITGSGTVSADGLALKTGNGGIGTLATPLAISANKLVAQAPAGIFVAKAAGALAIGGVGIPGNPTGVSTTAANGDISITTGTGITVNEAIAANGSGSVTLGADAFTFAAGVSGNVVTLQPKTAGRNFSLGAGTTASTTGISQAAISNITSSILRIGSAASNAGTVVFDGNLTMPSTQALSIISSGAVTQGTGNVVVTPGGFAAQTGAGNITLAEPNNDLRNVAINTTGDVNLRNLNGFSIGTVDGVKGMHAGNVTLTTGLTTTGTVALNSSSLTVASASGLAVGDRILIAGAGGGGADLIATITNVAGTTITFASKTFGTTDLTNATTAMSLAVTSTAGLKVNDTISITGAGAAGATLTTTITAITGNTLTLATGASTAVTNADVIKAITASTAVNNVTVTRLATTGTIALNSTSLLVGSTSGLAIGDRILVPGAGVSSGDLATTITGISGNTVTIATAASAGVTNAFVVKPTFIGGAATTGSAGSGSTTLTVASGAGYTIGNGIIVAGAGASGADLVTTVAGISGNTITLGTAAQTAVTNASVVHNDQAIVATGTVTLDSKLPSGYVESGGSLTANQLLLKGYGPYRINGIGSSNHVGTIAGDVTGGISYVDNAGFTIGTVGAAAGLTTRSMLVAPSTTSAGALYSEANISLSSSGPMQITQPVKAGVKNTPDPAFDPTYSASDRTGQALLFLVGDTSATTSGAGILEANLLNLSAELGKGTFDLTTNVGSLLLNGSKNATINNTAYTGLLTAFSLGVQDTATTGTVSSATTSPPSPASSITDNSQTFIPNQHFGRKIEITGGTGKGEIATITSNDAHTLVIASNWTDNGGVAPDSTSTYRIGENKDLRAGNVTLRTGGDVNVASINLTGNLVISSEKAGGKETITLVNSSGQNMLFRADAVTITAALTTPGVNVVLQPFTASNVVGVNNAAGAATNYSAATLNVFNPQANITIGGDTIDVTAKPVFATGATVGITGTPYMTGNVLIGADGPLNLGARTLNISTTGNIVAQDIGTVGNLAMVAGGAGGISLGGMNSTGANLLFKADALTLPGAAASYTTAAGVKVGLQPYTLSNFVGVHNSIDYHVNAVGSTTAGSDFITVNTTSGFAPGNTIDILGAGAGGATLTTTIAAQGPLVTLGATASTSVNSVTVNISPLIGAAFSTTGTIRAGSGTLIVASNAGINVGDTITVIGAGAGGANLATTVGAIPASSGMLISTAITSTTNTLVGLASSKQTVNTNYALDLLNKFNATAAITISGTTVTAPAPSNTLTGPVHIGSDGVTGVTPFDIGTRTLTVSTTGAIVTHSAATLATAASGTSATIPTGTTWVAGATPTPASGIAPPSGGGSGGTGGSGGGSGPGGTGSTGTGSTGPGTATGSTDPTTGSTGSATGTTPSTPPDTTPPGPPTPPGPTGGNPLPTPTTGTGDPGVIVIGYTPDPDPTAPPPDPVAVDPGTPPPGGTDPTIPPVAVDPGTPPGGTPPGGTDPAIPPVASDPGATPPGGTDPTIPPVAGDPGTPPSGTDPTIPPVAGDPGAPPAGTPPGGTDPTIPPVAGDPGTPPGGTPTGGTDPTIPPVAGDPGTPPGGTPTGGTDPTIPPVAGDPGTPPGGTPTGGTDPTIPPVAGDPGTPPGGTPTGGTDPTIPPVAGDPGTPPGGTPTGGTDPTIPPVAGDPGAPPGATPPGGTGDPSIPPVAGGPGTPPGGTPPGSTDPTPPAGPVASGPGTPPGSTDPGTPTGPIAGDPGTPPGSPGSSGSGGTGTTTASTGSTGGGATATTDPGGSASGGSGTTTASSGSAGTGTGSSATTDNATAATSGTTSGDGAGGSSKQATVNCPPGTTAAQNPAGGANPCVAVAVAGTGGKPAAQKPTVTAGSPATPPAPGSSGIAPRPVNTPAAIALNSPAAIQQNNAQAAGNAAPNTSGAPAAVLSVQGDGVNLYREGRGNGPGTPRR